MQHLCAFRTRLTFSSSPPPPPPPTALIRNIPSSTVAPCMSAGCKPKDLERLRNPSLKPQRSHHRQQVSLTNWSLVIIRTLAYWKSPFFPEENILQVK